MESGATSLMRYNALCAVLGRPADFRFDLSEVVARGSRLNRWLAWRFKSGPVVRDISACLVDLLLEEERFEFAWAVCMDQSWCFSSPSRKSDCLITPRPALIITVKNTLLTIDKYDVLVIMKSYCWRIIAAESRKVPNCSCLIKADVTIHRSYRSFGEKVQALVSLVMREDRIDLQAQVDARIPIHLCEGAGKSSFRETRKIGPHFYGTGLLERRVVNFWANVARWSQFGLIGLQQERLKCSAGYHSDDRNDRWNDSVRQWSRCFLWFSASVDPEISFAEKQSENA